MTDLSMQRGLAVEEVPGGPLVRERRAAPCTLVIFGATGDLTRRKLIPALYNLALDGELPEPFGAFGVSRQELPAGEFRSRLRAKTAEHSRRTPLDDATWERFAARLDYAAGDLTAPALYDELRRRLDERDRDWGTGGNRLFYFATPPALFPPMLERLHEAGLIGRQAPGSEPWARVIIEKPFGRDLESARELNALCATHLREHQTYRIDHYLGKETVQNLLIFRFGNSIFEPLWNRKYVDHIQITAAESIGVEGRGRFYDATGVVRDIVQNHLLQVLALFAMEPPASFEADHVRNEKVKVLESLRGLGGSWPNHDVVFGQYEGYAGEPGVAQGSRTPTYVAMKLHIDNWRWHDVPIYLRAGKALASKVTEIAVVFQHVPLCLFPDDSVCQRLESNVLTLRIQPDEGISLRFVSKVPGEDVMVSNVHMNMSYADVFETQLDEAYERLLLDAMRGDATLFARRDGVEAAWRFITPVVAAHEGEAAAATCRYAEGTSGPAEADRLIGRDGRRWKPLAPGA